MTRAADTIVAYTYKAETLCPTCTVQAVDTLHPCDPQTAASAEQVLDQLSCWHGINRYDEREYDSSDFPKVVRASQIESAYHCEECREYEWDEAQCCDNCGKPFLA